MGLISVIVPARDRASSIGRQLESLANQQLESPFEVIVADHGSVDDTADVARSFGDRFPRLGVIDVAFARGSAGARNAAADHAAGSILAFCDSDDVADPCWLGELVAPLAETRGLVGGRVVRVVEGRAVPMAWERPEPQPRPPTLGFLAFADTCNLAIHADDFHSLGGFDDLYVRCSDIEFSWRAQLSGLPLIDAPDAVMIKYEPPTSIALWTRHFAWARYRARLYAQFRAAGMPGPSARSVVAAYVRIAKSGLQARKTVAARHFVVSSAAAIGSLAGSLQWRVWFPWSL